MRKNFKFILTLLIILIFLRLSNYAYAETENNLLNLKGPLISKDGLELLIVILIPALLKSVVFIFNLPLKAFQNDISALNKDSNLISTMVASSIIFLLMMLISLSNSTYILFCLILLVLVCYVVVMCHIVKRIKSINEENEYPTVNNKVINRLKYSYLIPMVALCIQLLISIVNDNINVISVLYLSIISSLVSGGLYTIYLIHNFKPYILKVNYDVDVEIRGQVYILAETSEFIVIKERNKVQRPVSIAKSIIKEIIPISDENEETTSTINTSKEIQNNINQENRLEINYYDDNGEVKLKRKKISTSAMKKIFSILIEDSKLND